MRSPVGPHQRGEWAATLHRSREVPEAADDPSCRLGRRRPDLADEDTCSPFPARLFRENVVRPRRERAPVGVISRAVRTGMAPSWPLHDSGALSSLGSTGGQA